MRRFTCLMAILLASVLAMSLCHPVSGSAPPPPLPKDTLPAKIDPAAIPVGLPKDRNVSKDNPLTEAKVELGRRLFFDPLLSADRTIACASCHDPAHAFSGKESRAVGIGGKVGRRNAPTLFNRAYGQHQFWDGRVDTLEAQAVKPIEDPLEMGNTLPEVVKRLQDMPEYVERFQAAFPDGVTSQNIGRALASFQQTLLWGNTRLDRFILNLGYLNEEERQGLWLFESKGKCWKCHSGPNFTDEKFHNTGVGWAGQPSDLGRYEVTGKDEDRGRFKTPTLRATARTAPYMHDGSMATLEQVIEFYNKGCNPNPHLDPAIAPLGLTPADIKHLVAFLKALSTEE